MSQPRERWLGTGVDAGASAASSTITSPAIAAEAVVRGLADEGLITEGIHAASDEKLMAISRGTFGSDSERN